jgi:hypothetical protein
VVVVMMVVHDEVEVGHVRRCVHVGRRERWSFRGSLLVTGGDRRNVPRVLVRGATSGALNGEQIEYRTHALGDGSRSGESTCPRTSRTIDGDRIRKPFVAFAGSIRTKEENGKQCRSMWPVRACGRKKPNGTTQRWWCRRYERCRTDVEHERGYGTEWTADRSDESVSRPSRFRGTVGARPGWSLRAGQWASPCRGVYIRALPTPARRRRFRRSIITTSPTTYSSHDLFLLSTPSPSPPRFLIIFYGHQCKLSWIRSPRTIAPQTRSPFCGK